MPPTTKEGSGCFKNDDDDDDFTYNPPTILSEQSNQEINEGETIELHCLVDKLGMYILRAQSFTSLMAVLHLR